MSISLTVWGYVILVAGALVLGFAAQFLVRAETVFDWAIVAVAAGIGGFIASELLGAGSTWGPEIEGLFVLPALIGAVLFGVVADGAERLLYHPTA